MEKLGDQSGNFFIIGGTLPFTFDVLSNYRIVKDDFFLNVSVAANLMALENIIVGIQVFFKVKDLLCNF